MRIVFLEKKSECIELGNSVGIEKQNLKHFFRHMLTEVTECTPKKCS